MIDFSKLTFDELRELRKQTSDAMMERLNAKNNFCERILKLKEMISSFEDEQLALQVEGDDIYMRFLFEHGINAEFDELEYSRDFDVDEYNENEYEELFISGKEKIRGFDNFYIPLFGDTFEATTDISVLNDSDDEMRDYENILLIIHTDTVNYVFTKLVDYNFDI